MYIFCIHKILLKYCTRITIGQEEIEQKRLIRKRINKVYFCIAMVVLCKYGMSNIQPLRYPNWLGWVWVPNVPSKFVYCQT